MWRAAEEVRRWRREPEGVDMGRVLEMGKGEGQREGETCGEEREDARVEGAESLESELESTQAQEQAELSRERPAGRASDEEEARGAGERLVGRRAGLVWDA